MDPTTAEVFKILFVLVVFVSKMYFLVNNPYPLAAMTSISTTAPLGRFGTSTQDLAG